MAFADPQENIRSLGLSEGDYVVDLGAGSGFYTLAAAHAVGHSGRVYAIDVDQELLARIKNHAAAEKLHNVEVIHGDMEAPGGTRLRDKMVDAAIVSNVLFQIEHKENFIQELKRIIK